ncbi:iron-sulfur cluster assembly scaffold protein [Solimonas variicoloris]|uniref:iron-sulfur cluster assembly scaffold protein n=1 Tax=Solimonas variicoloris TaxID=254408 RepID=UPI00037A3176|nr:iron-sulfur cluster assembly scaffold protein [Solimonas variicoloris]
MNPQENVYAYREPIWARFRAPRHGGRLPDGGRLLEAQAGSPAAHSVLRLQLGLDGTTVARVRFQAYGCPTAIAVGEWLAEQLEGQPLTRLAAIDAGAIRDALEIPEDKAHCALMGEDVLRALQQQMSKQA